MYAYNASNTGGHTKKARHLPCPMIASHRLLKQAPLQNTINAITLVMFSLGNVIGTEIFQPKDAPAYIPGKIAIMVLLTVQLFISFLLRWINLRLNVKKKAQLAEEKAKRGWTDEDLQKERERHAFLDLTDKQYVTGSFWASSGEALTGYAGISTSCTLGNVTNTNSRSLEVGAVIQVLMNLCWQLWLPRDIRLADIDAGPH